MFCEPTQYGRFVRHPCNAYSNIVYVGAGLLALALASKEQSWMRVPDALFGIGLLQLSFVSFVWHASNVAWIHYVDLATMEAVIGYAGNPSHTGQHAGNPSHREDLLEDTDGVR